MPSAAPTRTPAKRYSRRTFGAMPARKSPSASTMPAVTSTLRTPNFACSQPIESVDTDSAIIMIENVIEMLNASVPNFAASGGFMMLHA